jgi:FkbM family methyltransferase
VQKIIIRYSMLVAIFSDWLAASFSKPVWHFIPNKVYRLYFERFGFVKAYRMNDMAVLETKDKVIFVGPMDVTQYMCGGRQLKKARCLLESGTARIDSGNEHAALVHNLVVRYASEFSSYPYSALRTRNLRSGDTFVDVGAFRGYVSLKAAMLVGKGGHVIALEPIEDNFKYILAHKALNAVDQLLAVNASVSIRDEESIEFYRVENQQNSEVSEYISEKAAVIKVPNYSVGKLCETVLSGGSERVVFSITTNGTEFELAKSVLANLTGKVSYIEISIPIIYTGGRLVRELDSLNAFSGVSVLVSYPWVTIVYSRCA